MIRGAAHLAANYKAVLDDVLGVAPEMTDHATLIHPGLEPPMVQEPPAPPSGPPVILASGRMVLEKGLDVAVAAMALIATRRPDARLVLAGEGPLRPALERCKPVSSGSATGSRSRAGSRLTGRLSCGRRRRSFSSRRGRRGLVSLPSRRLRWPDRSSRRMSEGCRVVSAGITGTLVPVGDVEALASAALALLDDPRRAVRYGRAARMRALARFSSARHLDAWDTLYCDFPERGGVTGRLDAVSD